MLHLNPNDNQQVKLVCQKAFPNYRGRRIRIEFDVKSINMRSYWDGGSKSSYAIVELSTNKTLHAPSSHPMFDKQVEGIDSFNIPEGYVIVQHTIFCGKDLGLTIHTRDSMPPLPSGQELTLNEKIVLYATRSLKSSYAGIKNYRFHEAKQATGITLNEYNAAKEILIEKKMLNKRGAITNEGRNAIGSGFSWPTE
jgi:hypothetical protein